MKYIDTLKYKKQDNLKKQKLIIKKQKAMLNNAKKAIRKEKKYRLNIIKSYTKLIYSKIFKIKNNILSRSKALRKIRKS